MNKPINRRNFLKYFTGGLLGAGLVPMVGSGKPIVMRVDYTYGTESAPGTASDQITIEPIDWDRVRRESDILDDNDEIINGLPESQWTDSVNCRADFFDKVTQGLIRDLK